MSTVEKITSGWEGRLAKLAAAQEADVDEVADAFAQQAYAAIENRAGAIMKDPYLLGFEVVDRNERNNRLIGAFAFGVGEELILAPVFFLNGKIKGQCLLYLKSRDRFVPNSKDQISTLLATARRSSDQGEPVSGRSARHATMEFDSRALGAPMRKSASFGDLDLVRDLWKQACAAAVRDVEVRPLLASAVASDPRVKSAALRMIAANHDFAECVVLARSMEHEPESLAKQAATTGRYSLILDGGEDAETWRNHGDNLFKMGFSIEDTRNCDCDVVMEGTDHHLLRTTTDRVIDKAFDKAGRPVKVLVAPTAAGCQLAVALEGDAKGSAAYGDCVFEGDAPADDSGDAKEVGVASPSGGKSYWVFSVSRRKFCEGGRLSVKSVSKDGPVTTIQREYGGAIVLRSDVEETEDDDLKLRCNETPVLGSDVRFIEANDEDLALMKSDGLWDMVLKKASATITVEPLGAGLRLSANGRIVDHASRAGGAMKLASFGISGDDVLELVDKAKDGPVTFHIVPRFEKLAHAWFETEPDMEEDFRSHAYDPDLGVPIDDMSGVVRRYPVRREQRVRDESLYGEARDPSAPDHLTDEQLLSVENPRELAAISEQMGLENIVDHGALGALVKTFDAVSLLPDMISDMEKGVDRLGRIVFLVMWKPNDFAEKFGEDDLPHLENKLVAAFEQHGDLVLALRRRSEDDK